MPKKTHLTPASAEFGTAQLQPVSTCSQNPTSKTKQIWSNTINTYKLSFTSYSPIAHIGLPSTLNIQLLIFKVDGDVTARRIYFRVMDKDTFTADDLIGKVSI